MINKWQLIELGRICKIQGGKRLPKGFSLIETKTSHPYIRARDVKNGKINFENPVYISDKAHEHISRYIVNEGQVVLTIAGTIGETALVTNEFDGANLTENAVKITADIDHLTPLFLKFLLQSEHIRSYFELIAAGAAQPKLGIYKIEGTKVNLPPLPTQRKIASILSAYDDLIENNLKRIKLLEEKAQLMYEEWFIRMRFPGHENVKIDEESGVPEGWKTKTIGSICTVSGGGTPSKANPSYWDGGEIIWFSPTDLSKSNSLVQLDSTNHITDAGLQKSSAKLLGPDSFMMTSRATIGLFGLIGKSFCTNQGFINITPHQLEDKEFLLFNFKWNVPLFMNFASGTTFLEISRGNFKTIPIVWPAAETRKGFHQKTKGLIDMTENLLKQNSALKEARDILLPRLMTGLIKIQ